MPLASDAADAGQSRMIEFELIIQYLVTQTLLVTHCRGPEAHKIVS